MKTYLPRYWKPFLAVVFWGISFVATKIALKELSPREIIFVRLVLGAGLLFIIARVRKRSLAISKENLLGIFILALIAVFHLWIQVTGLQFTSATNTGWLIGTTPVFMAIVGFIVFREKLFLLNIAGIILAFAGLILLMSNGDFSSIGFISNKGDLMVLASAFTWSIYSVVNKKISLSYPPILTILFLFLIMGVIISPFTITGGFADKILIMSPAGWGSVLFLGIFCSGLAYVFWAESLKNFSAAKTGAFLYFEPFVTVITAWLILNEDITLFVIFSGIIITAGVIMVNAKSYKKHSQVNRKFPE